MSKPLSLPVLQDIAALGGYAGTVTLSNSSALLALSAAVWYASLENWEGDGATLTSDEIDDIESLIDTLQFQLMTTGIPEMNSASYIADETSDYTTSSTSFANIDSTNFALELTTLGGDVMIGFTGSCGVDYVPYFVYFDVWIDDGTGAVSLSGDDGMIFFWGQSHVRRAPIVISWLERGLAADTYTFYLRWKVNTSSLTAKLFASSATTGADIHPIFWVKEC